MSVSPELREQVRQRAACACEFCGVTETDVGGGLTIDHFQPQQQQLLQEQRDLLRILLEQKN